MDLNPGLITHWTGNVLTWAISNYLCHKNRVKNNVFWFVKLRSGFLSQTPLFFLPPPWLTALGCVLESFVLPAGESIEEIKVAEDTFLSLSYTLHSCSISQTLGRLNPASDIEHFFSHREINALFLCWVWEKNLEEYDTSTAYCRKRSTTWAAFVLLCCTSQTILNWGKMRMVSINYIWQGQLTF